MGLMFRKIRVFQKILLISFLQSLILLSCTKTEKYYSFIIVPDTQYLSYSYPQVFKKEMNWIVKNKELLNIQYVFHMGDITDQNQEFEWKVADSCLKKIEVANIPYSLVYGDNDIKNPYRFYDRYDGIRHTELLNKYFPQSRFEKHGSSGNFIFYEPGKIDNSYSQFRYDGDKYIILNLEIAPRDRVLRWADSVINHNVSRKVIIITHDYIDADGKRLDDLKSFGMEGKDSTGVPRGNDANEIFKRLIKDNFNVFMLLCGHKTGDCVNTIKTKASGDSGKKRRFFEILTDYQNVSLDGSREGNGNGLIRIMKIYPAKNKIVLSSVCTLNGKHYGKKVTLSF